MKETAMHSKKQGFCCIAASIFVAFLYSINAAEDAQASPVLHSFTMQQTSPTAETFVGSFEIDSSELVPGTVTFSKFISFSIDFLGLSWTLADAAFPTTEGVFVDSTGTVAHFGDVGSGVLVEFDKVIGPVAYSLDFSDTGGSWIWDTITKRPGEPDAVMRGGGTVSIATVKTPPGPAVPSVPVAPALPLMATGLMVLGLVGWRRNRAA